MKTNQTPHIATGEELRPILNTLQSMQDWAINSIAYVKRRNHLLRTQKHFIKERLTPYINYLQERIDGLQEGVFETQLAAINYDIQQALIGQAKFNQYAWFYEFPRYPLPEPIPQPFDFDLTMVTEDSLERMLYIGDDLFLKPVYSLGTLEPNDLLVVTYRTDYRFARKQHLGWFKGLIDNVMVLQLYRDVYKKPNWWVSMHEVVHIQRVRWVNDELITPEKELSHE